LLTINKVLLFYDQYKFDLKILENCDKECVLNIEQYYIDL